MTVKDLLSDLSTTVRRCSIAVAMRAAISGGVPVVGAHGAARCWPARLVASCPITSSMTRAGTPASSSQVAKVWRKSWAPCRSTASTSGSRAVGNARQRC